MVHRQLSQSASCTTIDTQYKFLKISKTDNLMKYEIYEIYMIYVLETKDNN